MHPIARYHCLQVHNLKVVLCHSPSLCLLSLDHTESLSYSPLEGKTQENMSKKKAQTCKTYPKWECLRFERTISFVRVELVKISEEILDQPKPTCILATVSLASATKPAGV